MEIYFKVIDQCELLEPTLGINESELSPDELRDFLELLLEQLARKPDELPRALIIRKKYRDENGA